MKSAYLIDVYGTVQGVGFRPFIYRLAKEFNLTGWVLNNDEGVKIWVEGELGNFVANIESKAPAAANITNISVQTVPAKGFEQFTIKESQRQSEPTTAISPDLAICEDCLTEMRDKNNRRYGYPYINCTNCGPRYSIITALPYDRPNTTMKAWALCELCLKEYNDPLNRRFHAQPTACPNCGPRYYLKHKELTNWDTPAIQAAKLLSKGNIIALKGLGGYHLACDARDVDAVKILRERKFRKEKAFAVMVKDLDVAARFAHLSDEGKKLLTSPERPIVLLQKKRDLAGVAPVNHNLGMMLPYTPIHHLLFDHGAPDALVMTSANRSSEPIAFEDQAALEQLEGIADAFLIGERPIARRMDDSVIRPNKSSVTLFRKARGYAPRAVANLPSEGPILAVGADLKNSITLVVDGQAFVSQHIGDLEHYGAFKAFQETIGDLVDMYGLRLEDCIVVHDAHPNYQSTQYALDLPAKRHIAVQHHQAHIASVLAEKQAWDTNVIGVAFDGTGYGDDGAIWGGEFFQGSLTAGFDRIGHLDYAKLVGGDAAAKFPVLAAAGFLAELDTPDLSQAPFNFPESYVKALKLLEKDIQVLPTSSVGRLFDAAAALLGFTREMSFEGQAAMWLEYWASKGKELPSQQIPKEPSSFYCLQQIIKARLAEKERSEIASAFHNCLVKLVSNAVRKYCHKHAVDTVVFAGGVFQNKLVLEKLQDELTAASLAVWLNEKLPTNDGGISLGQAAASLGKIRLKA